MKPLRNKTDKYTFGENGGESMYHPDGYKVPDDEPILIFRAKDLGTLAAITSYLDMLIEQEPSSTIKTHIISMLNVTEAIVSYQKTRSVKSVTCSQKAHRATIKGLYSDCNEAVENAIKHLSSVYGFDFEYEA